MRGRPPKHPDDRRRACSISMSPESWDKLKMLKRDLAAKSVGSTIEWLIEKYENGLTLEDWK